MRGLELTNHSATMADQLNRKGVTGLLTGIHYVSEPIIKSQIVEAGLFTSRFAIGDPYSEDSFSALTLQLNFLFAS